MIFKFIAVVLSIATASGPITSTQDAIRFLETTRPQLGGAMEALSKSDAEMDLYLRQVQALSVIKGDDMADCVGLLIPYLNYSLNPAEFTESRSPTDRHEYIENTIRVWPAFGAILRMKDASNKLKEYCSDIHNPLNYRLASFLVLRYVDKDSFVKVEHMIDIQLSGVSPAAKEYLKRVEDGSEQFWGVPNLE